MRNRRPFLGAVAFLAFLSGLAGRADAEFVVSLQSSSLNGSTWTYVYGVTIGATEIVQTGDSFRIHDFGGYIDGSITAPLRWTASTALLSAPPPPNLSLTLGDDPTIPNLIFTYTDSAPLSAIQVIGLTFTARSTSGITTLRNYVGQNTAANGAPLASVGEVGVPVVLVPEPASLLLAGLGFMILWTVRGRRVHRDLPANA